MKSIRVVVLLSVVGGVMIAAGPAPVRRRGARHSEEPRRTGRRGIRRPAGRTPDRSTAWSPRPSRRTRTCGRCRRRSWPSRARPGQAKALPDPMVSVLYVNDGWSPSLGEMSMTTLGFMGSQTFPWPGKRGLREKVATQDAVAPAERLERQRLTVAAGVRRAFWGLVLAEESLGVLREQEDVWKEAESRRARPLRRGPGRAAGRPPRPGGDHPLRAAAGGAGGGPGDAARRALAPRRARGGA